jgi:hypothetical protein
MTSLAAIPGRPRNGSTSGRCSSTPYGIAYVVAVTAAILITRWRRRPLGGHPDLPHEIAMKISPVHRPTAGRQARIGG